MLKNHILIVEDEVLIANLLKRMVIRHGYNCAGIAISYNQALVILETQKVDAVLIDVNIYGEKSGIELGALLQKVYKIPFVYLTSDTDAHTLSKIKETTPAAYLVKPTNDAALNTTLDLLFEKASPLKKEIFSFEIGATFYRIQLDELLYVKSNANYVELQLLREKKLIRSSLKLILEIFPDNSLLRINRTVAINPRYISAIKGSTLTTSFGEIFKVTDLHIAHVRDTFQKKF